MAYSDYGGYAYRNGIRIEGRSDCTITPEGDTFGTPGSWPGFAMIAAGIEKDEVEKRLSWPSGHAVLGDGPSYVVLYKQSSTSLYRGPEEIDLLSTVDSPVIAEWTDDTGKLHRWLETDHYKDSGNPVVARLQDAKVTIFYEETDNHYQYVQVEQDDGVVWHGWSGYGVGAGLEDCDYGYSTSDCEDRLWELFQRPRAAIAGAAGELVVPHPLETNQVVSQNQPDLRNKK